ncbi:hypothetical protein L484_013339 [Morus notabilis]|uniref:Uncharacterized protein n=1 Tax=Morus notabilis TaxID=981085 RepID=W9RXN0_9ROSA|nr:hypothetical protein L484_013339 [Morus notabilis]
MSLGFQGRRGGFLRDPIGCRWIAWWVGVNLEGCGVARLRTDLGGGWHRQLGKKQLSDDFKLVEPKDGRGGGGGWHRRLVLNVVNF